MIASTQTNHPMTGIIARADAQVPQTASQLDEACARLKAAGLRITQPRIAILSVLLEQVHPVSIEAIFHGLETKSCDLVTVYRCLAAFEEVGLVRRSFSHNGTSLYAMALSGEGRFHVLCKETQQVEEIDGAPADQLRAAIKRVQESLVARGYKDVAYSVEFFGVSQQATAKPESAAKVPAPALQTV